MKRIPLTQGKYALVDDKDFAELSKHKWYAAKLGNTFYAVRNVSDKTKRNGQRIVKMHRVILGTKKGQICDHIDRNGLNNMRSNLRFASKSLNGLNRHQQKNNTSGYKGVFWHKRNGKWCAQIRIDNKSKHLGYFKTPEKASACYQKAFKIRMAELTTD